MTKRREWGTDPKTTFKARKDHKEVFLGKVKYNYAECSRTIESDCEEMTRKYLKAK